MSPYFFRRIKRSSDAFWNSLIILHLFFYLYYCSCVHSQLSPVCCAGMKGNNRDNDGKEVSGDFANKCENRVTAFIYSEDASQDGTGKIESLPCDICTLKMYPWRGTDKKFVQSCLNSDKVKDFNKSYGEAGECKYHPDPDNNKAFFSCACKSHECNKLADKLKVPSENWDVKYTKEPFTCDNGGYSRIKYDGVKVTTSTPTDCLKEEELNDEQKRGQCIATYKLKNDGTAGSLQVICVSGKAGKHLRIDEWSAKFPKRKWEYPGKSLPDKNPDDSKDENKDKNDQKDGATTIIATVTTNILLGLATWTVL